MVTSNKKVVTANSAGNFKVTIKYGKKKSTVSVPVKVSSMTAKLKTSYSVKEGTTFSTKTFKKNITVKVKYKGSGSYTKVAGYTVTPSSQTVKPIAKGKYKGKFKVVVKYGTAKKAVYVPVKKLSSVTATIGSSYTLTEGDTFSATTFRKNATVKVKYTGSKTYSKITGYTVTPSSKTVTPISSGTYKGKFKVTITYSSKTGSKTTDVYIPVSKPTGIVASSTITELAEGTTFDETAFRKATTVELKYANGTTKAISNYTVTVPNTTVTPDSSENFVVTIKYGSCTTTVPILVNISVDEVDWLKITYSFASYDDTNDDDSKILFNIQLDLPSEYSDIHEIGYTFPIFEDTLDANNLLLTSPNLHFTILNSWVSEDSSASATGRLSGIPSTYWDTAPLNYAKVRIYAKVVKNGTSYTVYSKIYSIKLEQYSVVDY